MVEEETAVARLGEVLHPGCEACVGSGYPDNLARELGDGVPDRDG